MYYFISICVWGFVLGRRRLLYNLSTSFLLKYFTQHFFVQWCIVLNNCINKVSCLCFFPNTDMSLRCFYFMSQIIITDLIIKSVELVKTYRSHFVTLFLEYYFHCNTGVLIFTITARWRYSLLFSEHGNAYCSNIIIVSTFSHPPTPPIYCLLFYMFLLAKLLLRTCLLQWVVGDFCITFQLHFC